MLRDSITYCKYYVILLGFLTGCGQSDSCIDSRCVSNTTLVASASRTGNDLAKATHGVLKEIWKSSLKDVLIESPKNGYDRIASAQGCVNPAMMVSYQVVYASYYRIKKTLMGEGYPVAVPKCLKHIIRENYDLDPDSIHLRMEVRDTPDNRTAITLEDTIFFPYDFNFLKSKKRLYWLLHEIEHVTQWRKKGVAGFIAEYVCATGVNLSKFDPIAIHKQVQLETAASSKAYRLKDQVWDGCFGFF